jgi:hypothetical protein
VMNPCFRDVGMASFQDSALIVTLLKDVGNKSRSDANYDTQKANADSNRVEPVTGRSENHVEGPIEQKGQPIQKPVVEGSKLYNRFTGQKPKWPCKGDAKQLF